jgi:hypothetical protein
MADPLKGPFTILMPWYVTFFRGNKFAEALQEIAPVAMKYGATSYHLYRSQEDLYQFWQWTAVPDKIMWEKYWYGPEFQRWRAEHSSWYQVPLVYTVTHEIASGAIEHETVELDV